MNKLERRDILKLIIASVPTLSIASLISSVPETTDLPMEATESLLKIHLAWTNAFDILASEYLANLPGDVFQQKGSLTKLIQSEFAGGKIIEVEGLLLSVTEVATASAYAELLIDQA